MSDLQGIIAKWGEAFTVTRTTKGTLTNGIYGAGSTSSVGIVASIQPMTGTEVKPMPEGRRLEDLRLVFTTTELKTASDSYDPDRFTIDGSTFEVIKVEHWQAWGSGHYRCVIARREHA